MATTHPNTYTVKQKVFLCQWEAQVLSSLRMTRMTGPQGVPEFSQYLECQGSRWEGVQRPPESSSFNIQSINPY